MLLNYSTTIEAEQTIREIQKMLADHGVTSMRTDYEGRNISAVSFLMSINDKQMAFKMPCNWRAVQEIFKKQNLNRKKINGRLPDRINDSDEHVIKVAWRIIHTWIKAQLALVEVNMVTVPQIFLPFSVMRDGRTLAEHIESDPGFLLGNGK